MKEFAKKSSKHKAENEPRPEAEPVEFLDGIQYDGPPELAGLWNEFTRSKGAALKGSNAVYNANLLNALAFGEGGAQTVVAKHFQRKEVREWPVTDDKEEQRQQENEQHELNVADWKNKQNKRLQNDLLCAGQALAHFCGNDQRKLPLHREVEERLIAQWCALRGAPLSLKDNTLIADETEDKRTKLLHKPEGGILTGALRGTSDYTIEVRMQGHRIREDFREATAQELLFEFNARLFNFKYRPHEERTRKHPCSFNTYVGNNMQNMLKAIYNRKGEYEIPTARGGNDNPDGDDLFSLLAAPPEGSKHDEEVREFFQKLLRLIPKEQRQALEYFHGLNGEEAMSYQQIAETMDCDVPRVTKLLNQARSTLKRHLEKHGIDLPESFVIPRQVNKHKPSPLTHEPR